MKIEANRVVSIALRVCSDTGEELARTKREAPIHFVYGGGLLMTNLEERLAGLEAGTRTEVTLEPEEAFGPWIPALVRQLPRGELDSVSLLVGLKVRTKNLGGIGAARVVAFDDENVTLDFNQLLAGKRLHFDVEILEVRDADSMDMSMMGGCLVERSCDVCDAHGLPGLIVD